ncbi:MAG: tol-pal system-associated acyl-CoA thioesterase [Alphaproteobacteria bacterium]
MEHKTQIRVYYEDTDAAGVVYYANYLKFAERGRTELLRSAGLENKSLAERQGISFVVRHIEADYFRPAHLDDLLILKTSLVQLKNANVSMKQSLYLKSDLIFSLDVQLACVDVKTFKPAKLDETVKQAFGPYLKAS